MESNEEKSQKQEHSKHASDDMLMGNRPGQLNLSNIRSRSVDIEKNIDELLFILRYAPWSLHWNDVVDKMAVMNVQLQQLQDELRPVSHHYAVHPKSVNQQNSVTVPIMLASRLYPEQHATYTEIYLKEKKSENHELWKQSVEEMCTMLTGPKGLLDPRGSQRRRLAQRGIVDGHRTLPVVTKEEQDMLNAVGFGRLPS